MIMNKKNIAKLVPLVLTICVLIVVSLSLKSNNKDYTLLEDKTIEVQQVDNATV